MKLWHKLKLWWVGGELQVGQRIRFGPLEIRRVLNRSKIPIEDRDGYEIRYYVGRNVFHYIPNVGWTENDNAIRLFGQMLLMFTFPTLYSAATFIEKAPFPDGRYDECIEPNLAGERLFT